eukprot:m.307393 g.307393  ORF g.307393 m.307393 type:complete len:363 (+) comp42227_c0_seq1:35-1123(+)
MLFFSSSLLLTVLSLLHEGHSFDAHVARVKAIAQRMIDVVSSKSPIQDSDLFVDYSMARRSADQDPVSPDYSTNYSVGALGKCSRPAIPHCSFPSSVTIPEYYARLYPKMLGPSMNTIYNNLHSNLGGCMSSILDFLCKFVAVPRCISATTVKYDIPDFQTACSTAVKQCPADMSTILDEELCSNPKVANPENSVLLQLQGKTFSLTQCRIPSFSVCSNSLPLPDWMASETELTVSSLTATLDQIEVDEDCKNKLYEFACTRPTCNNGSFLVGHRTKAECNEYLTCIPDSDRDQVANIFDCSAFTGLDKPSDNTGTTKSAKPWWIWLCVGVGGAIGLVALFGVFMCVFKKRSDASYIGLPTE